MIPKIIHYCWVSEVIPETIPEKIPDTIPENFVKCLRSWKKLSGYQFMLWNFNRFNINSSIWVKEAFEAKKYAFVADYIRVYAVYTYGGIYLDMDVEIIKPFDNLLNNDIMFARSNNVTKNVEAGCFGAGKKSRYVKKILDYYKDRHFINQDGSCDTYPVPLIIYNIFHNSFPEIEDKIYPSDYFTANHSIMKEISVTQNTYCIHHFEGSWLSKVEKENNKIKYSLYKVFGVNFLSRSIIQVAFLILRIRSMGFMPTILYYKNKIKHHKV
jgi:mannosyltransferase OCH1-like enzyme